MTQKLKPLEILVLWHIIHVIKSRWSIYGGDIFLDTCCIIFPNKFLTIILIPTYSTPFKKRVLPKCMNEREEVQVIGLTLPVFWGVWNLGGGYMFLPLLMPFFLPCVVFSKPCMFSSLLPKGFLLMGEVFLPRRLFAVAMPGLQS